MTDTERWLAGVAALVGAWIFASAFLFEMPDSHFWNNIAVGGAIAILAAYSGYRAMEGSMNMWVIGLAALLGLWMIATPFVYESVSDAVLYSDVVGGAVVAILGGYDAYMAQREERTMGTEREMAQ